MKQLLITLFLLSSITSAMAYDEEVQRWSHVSSAERLKEILQYSSDNPERKSWESIILTADIYLDEISGGGFGDFLSAFCGILNGDGHTIYGGREDRIYNCKPLFSNTDGARFRNIRFKNIRVNSDDDPNMAVIARNAKNSQFTDVTMENVHTWSDYNNVGTLAAYAEDYLIKDVVVTRSDCTTDAAYVGCVVGNSKNNTYSNVVVDDLCCADADGSSNAAYVGGIMGRSEGDHVTDCINSAIVIGDDTFIGGLTGAANGSTFSHCLNTGMVLSAPQRNASELHDKYANKRFPCETKCYEGREYTIRTDNETHTSWYDPEYTVGGIVGTLTKGELAYCTNFGFLNSTKHSGDTGGCGGLVAQFNATDSYIHDCFTDFKYYAGKDNFMYGFIGGVTQNNARISNCLSTSKDQLVFKDAYTYNNDVLPCYSLRTNTTRPKNEITVTEEDLNYGRVCIWLGKGWRQNLGYDRTPTPKPYGNLYHYRPIGNEYGTVCLPYRLSSLYAAQYYILKEATSADGEACLMFESVDEVPAGTPALFRISDRDYLDVSMWDDDEIVDAPVDPSMSGEWSMYGTFGQQVFSGDEARCIYYISDGKVKHASKVTVAPFRAYLVGPSIDQLNGSPAQVRIMLDDEEATDLQLVVEDRVPGQSGKAYTLYGTEAGEGYRGVVVRGGKKVMR